MAPAAKIAAGAALAGLMVAIMVMGARQPARRPVTVSFVPTSEMPDHLRDMLARCRVATMPESGCEAAWDAERRHFFDEDHSDAAGDKASSNEGERP